jgi:hypothetical protein
MEADKYVYKGYSVWKTDLRFHFYWIAAKSEEEARRYLLTDEFTLGDDYLKAEAAKAELERVSIKGGTAFDDQGVFFTYQEILDAELDINPDAPALVVASTVYR